MPIDAVRKEGKKKSSQQFSLSSGKFASSSQIGKLLSPGDELLVEYASFGHDFIPQAMELISELCFEERLQGRGTRVSLVFTIICRSQRSVHVIKVTLEYANCSKFISHCFGLNWIM